MNLGGDSYDILVQRGILSSAGQHLNLNRRVLVVTDSGVPAEYAETVAAQCRNGIVCTVESGEASKSLDGFGKLLQTIRLVQGGPNPNLTIEGFVVTMFDGRTKVHNQVLGELKEHFKEMVFDTIIQRNIRLSEAPSHGKPIILYDVICNGTTNYLSLAREVLEKNGYQVSNS